MSGSNRRRCCCGNPLCDDVSFFCSTCEQQVPSRQPVSYSMFFHDVEVLKLNGCIKCPDSFGAGTFGNYSFGRQFIDKCGSNARINRKLLAGTTLNNCYYSQTDSLPGGGEVNPGVPGFLYWYEYGGGAGFPPDFDCTCGTPTAQVGFTASMELGVDGNQVRVQVIASYIEDFTGSHNIWGWIIFDGTGGDDRPVLSTASRSQSATRSARTSARRNSATAWPGERRRLHAGRRGGDPARAGRLGRLGERSTRATWRRASDGRLLKLRRRP
jgi:hypothetical protein